MTSHEYFFELLTEEIPAWMLPPPSVARDLDALCASEFGLPGALESGLILVDATPRRLFFRISGIPERQPDREEEVKGPPRKMAYGADGAPTPALLGFLKKNSATTDDIISRDTDDYVRLRRVVHGKSAAEILQSGVPAIIEGIRWPKTMRWGTGEHSFIRPVHSVISVFGGKVVPLKIFDVEASDRTVGHRILAPERLHVSSYGSYVETLGAAHVVVEASMRERMMRQKCDALGEQIGGRPAVDATIWQQWRHLTEFPGIVRAQFNPDYLVLPEEVLITVMRVHQKQLPIVKDGKLTNSFLAVMDQVDDHDGNVASGNAFVSNARFADARFFYETDRRRKLEERVEDLAHLQFQEKLGNYLEKTRRISAIAEKIHQAAKSQVSRDQLRQAARLCKADLMTEMVKEFTELQGKIGGIYAREEGLPEEVWQAVYDHYLPVSGDDPLPRGAVGATVSLADRIDTLAGFFLLGMKPTGSKDPFALRRAAQGAVQILLNRAGWVVDLPMAALIHIGLEAHGADATAMEKARGELLEFFSERVRTQLENAPFGFAYDEVAAVMASRWSDSLSDLVERAGAIREIRSTPQFLSILRSAKRIANITEGQEVGRVDRGLLEHPTEQRLADLSGVVGSQIEEMIREKKYPLALESFAGLAGELETFFNDVLVMAEDPAVRKNRMALLQQVGQMVGKIAEVTRIVIDRSDYAAGAE
jgi:glycyl-tRNA synthetase beta chain